MKTNVNLKMSVIMVMMILMTVICAAQSIKSTVKNTTTGDKNAMQSSGSNGTAEGGRGVIVGAEGAAYKTVRNRVEGMYENTTLQTDFSSARLGAKKVKKGEKLTTEEVVDASDAAAPATKKVNSNLIPAEKSEDNIMSVNLGEPVPGAVINMELEANDNQKINTYNSVNPFSMTLPMKSNSSLVPGKLEFNIRLTESCFPYFLKDGKKMVSNGIYIFGVETSINKVKFFHELAVVVNEVVPDLVYDSAPFGQALSNMGDNGKVINPALQENAEVSVRVFLMNSFTAVQK